MVGNYSPLYCGYRKTMVFPDACKYRYLYATKPHARVRILRSALCKHCTFYCSYARVLHYTFTEMKAGCKCLGRARADSACQKNCLCPKHGPVAQLGLTVACSGGFLRRRAHPCQAMPRMHLSVDVTPEEPAKIRTESYERR